VFVVTHEKRDSRTGATTFHFVNDGIECRSRQVRPAWSPCLIAVLARGWTLLVNSGPEPARALPRPTAPTMIVI
jgi:hypothetical protein